MIRFRESGVWQQPHPGALLFKPQRRCWPENAVSYLVNPSGGTPSWPPLGQGIPKGEHGKSHVLSLQLYPVRNTSQPWDVVERNSSRSRAPLCTGHPARSCFPLSAVLGVCHCCFADVQTKANEGLNSLLIHGRQICQILMNKASIDLSNPYLKSKDLDVPSQPHQSSVSFNSLY